MCNKFVQFGATASLMTMPHQYLTLNLKKIKIGDTNLNFKLED
jgi:hypothetical protein